MPSEKQLASDRPDPPPAASEAALHTAEADESSAAPIWLQRLSLLVLVLFCVYLGGLVAYLPWWTRVWDRNLFFQSHPTLNALAHNGAVRGLVTGLGLLDIWIGISEAVHYRDHRS
jgi:hypothetical protein